MNGFASAGHMTTISTAQKRKTGIELHCLGAGGTLHGQRHGRSCVAGSSVIDGKGGVKTDMSRTRPAAVDQCCQAAEHFFVTWTVGRDVGRS